MIEIEHIKIICNLWARPRVLTLFKIYITVFIAKLCAHGYYLPEPTVHVYYTPVTATYVTWAVCVPFDFFKRLEMK